MRTQRKSNHRGDTMVEVLIAIAIVGLVLAQAYASATRSLRGTQDSQERAESSKVVEEQIELLRTVGEDTPNAIFDVAAPDTFCLSTARAVISDPSFNPPGFQADDFLTYPPECSARGPGTRYNVFIQRDATDANKFYFHSRWDRLGGGKNQVEMTYRFYAN